MSSTDFTSNNDPSDSTAGRGQRVRTNTASIAQYHAEEAKKALSRTRRQERRPMLTPAAIGFLPVGGAAMPAMAQQSPHSFANMGPPHRLYAQPSQLPVYPYLTHHIPDMPQSADRHTIADAEAHAARWDAALRNQELYAFSAQPSGHQASAASAHQASAAFPFLNPEEEDEMYDDPEANMSDDRRPLDGQTVQDPIIPETPTRITPAPQQLVTPQNLRAFPQATSRMSAAAVEVPRAPLVRRVINRTYPDMSGLSETPAMSSPTLAAATATRPLIHRTNIFGLGLHDDRQRPRQAADKENAVHRLSDDDTESGPPKKKSRKEPAARSIVNIAPDRVPVLELTYHYVILKVLTDATKTWTQGRAALALFTQDGWDWAIARLGLDPAAFGPVTHEEQDLCRERVYSTRGDFKELARIVITGPDGYDFVLCSSKASKVEQDRVATINRKLVAELTDRSAFVFENPHDRTVKNSMYKHASIETLIRLGIFAGLLSDGMQYPEFFDDTLPDEHDDTQPPHKPTFSMVAITVVTTSLRAAIMEFSSGHHIPEVFARKVFKAHFDADLETLRAWHTYTSNPTLVSEGPPVRMAPATFLTRTLQERIFHDARYNVLKDVVAPVASLEVMGDSDFALNQ
ncbi:hypothetical protein DFH06DRAFT_1332694 [Mycena polygramma]|nr:hypothetical protein DFH06DRAFT_1332694 [Mycena polygramma]